MTSELDLLRNVAAAVRLLLMDGEPLTYSQTDDAHCHHCHAWRDAEPHEPDCTWLRLRRQYVALAEHYDHGLGTLASELPPVPHSLWAEADGKVTDG